MSDTMTEPTLDDVMKSLGYDAVLILRKPSCGFIWYSRGEMAMVSAGYYETAHDAGEDFLRLVGHQEVGGPVPEVPDPRIQIWSLSMALVGGQGIPIYSAVEHG